MSREVYVSGAFLSYPHLFETWTGNDGTGDPKYQCKLILPQTFNWDAMSAAVTEAVTDKFGAQPPANLTMPWSVIEDGPYKGFYQLATSAYPDNPPRVVDQALNPVINKELVFAGIEVNAYVYASGYDTKGNRGVRLGLNALQIVRNDDSIVRLDSRKDITEIFKPLAGAPVATAPGGGFAPHGAPQGVPTGAPQQQQHAPEQGPVATGAPLNPYAPR